MALSTLLHLELPLAYICLGLTLISLVWEVYGTLPWFPGFDPVWGTGEGDMATAQYPRKPIRVIEMRVFYAFLYGVLGTMGQYAGLQISRDADNRSMNKEITIGRARRLGFFHTMIGIHHIGWMAKDDWGRLDFSQSPLPKILASNIPWVFGLLAAITMFHGVGLLLCDHTTSFDQIIRKKTLVDMSSVMTLIELVFFLFENWMGFRNSMLEIVAWVTTVLAPAIMLTMDYISEREFSFINEEASKIAKTK